MKLLTFSEKRGRQEQQGGAGASGKPYGTFQGGFMIQMWICSTFNWNSLRIHGAENVRGSGNEDFERPNVSCK